MEAIEKHFNCPYCGEKISMMLDISSGSQQYIEDCETCCRPIEIKFSITDDFIENFNSSRTDT